MSARFDLRPAALQGLTIVQRKPMRDERGYFERIFCVEELSSLLGSRTVAQINRSLTTMKGAVRGLHFQHPPHAETKFVSCVRGEIFDVAVDLRRGSPTFLRWHGELLSAENHRSLVIPEGFAHGFQAMTENCEVVYVSTAAYCADAEAGLNARDPRLRIEWPLDITELSPRDQRHPVIESGFAGVAL